MKYYQIGVSFDPKIIGVKNGIYQVVLNLDIIKEDKDFEVFFEFFDYHKNINFFKRQNEIQFINIPIIEGFLIHKAKLTDVMGYSKNISFLNGIFSDKFISILKKESNVVPKTFQINIENVSEKYFLKFNNIILFEEFNFTKSLLFTGHKVMNNFNYHSIENYENYLKQRDSFPLISFEKICIPKKYYGNDIIDTQGSGRTFYSERLINKLLENGITGLDVKYNSSTDLCFY